MNRIKVVSFIFCLLSFYLLKAQTYLNYAEGKPVSTSWESKNKEWLTDGSLVSGSFKTNSMGMRSGKT